MPINRIIKGDLLDLFAEGIHFDAIAHGANCFHTMGAGIAGQIAERFPEAYAADKAHHSPGDLVAQGTYSYAHFEFGTLFNIYSQYTPGRVPTNGIVTNVDLAFAALNRDLYPKTMLAHQGQPIIGIPMIGAGIAGGDWKKIAERINQVTPLLDITLVEYQKSKKS